MSAWIKQRVFFLPPWRDVLDRIGPLDERLITREQMDFALRLKVAGESVTFEKGAVVTYNRGGPVTPADLDYFLFRWSHPLALLSLDSFEASWGVKLQRQRILRAWIGNHRFRAIKACAPELWESLGKEKFRRLIVPLYEAMAIRDVRSNCRWTPLAPPDPPQEVRYKVFGELVARRARTTERSMSA